MSGHEDFSCCAHCQSPLGINDKHFSCPAKFDSFCHYDSHQCHYVITKESSGWSWSDINTPSSWSDVIPYHASSVGRWHTLSALGCLKGAVLQWVSPVLGLLQKCSFCTGVIQCLDELRSWSSIVLTFWATMTGSLPDDVGLKILQFLDFEDKLRFACVSKDWQRIYSRSLRHLEIQTTGCKKAVNAVKHLNWLRDDWSRTVQSLEIKSHWSCGNEACVGVLGESLLFFSSSHGYKGPRCNHEIMQIHSLFVTKTQLLGDWTVSTVSAHWAARQSLSCPCIHG